MTLNHKTSHKGQVFQIEIYTSAESWTNMLSIDVWFVRIGQYLVKIQLFENWNLRMQKDQTIEKTTFKIVQIKSLATHITN